MEARGTSERRGTERAPVELWVTEEGEREAYYHRATSLSLGGLFLDRTLPHAPGTVVQLKVRLGDTGPELFLSGEVVEATRELGMGVRFRALPPEPRRLLTEYLQRVTGERQG
ncbi:MAG: PilZ domain-containing protein [Deltaproteobacteria bacterium]|nr:PilZ domain-containing protein [Deltaproteobacteria bacterium]